MADATTLKSVKVEIEKGNMRVEYRITSTEAQAALLRFLASLPDTNRQAFELI